MSKFNLLSLMVCTTLIGCGGSGGGNNDVPAVNQAPTISAAANLSVDANQQTTIDVAISDDSTAGQDLTVQAVADNPVLFPTASIIVRNGGENRSIALIPATDETGTSSIDVRVTDTDGLSASTRIDVSVVALQRQAALFSRSLAQADATDEPTLINALEFLDDAENDDFADLLSP